jgi:hypothetical protein
MLSVGAGDGIAALPAAYPVSGGTNTPIAGYTPSEIRRAYGIDQITFDKQMANPVAADGSGQTIAVVGAYADPSIANDLATFDRTFGLPNANLIQAGPPGQAPIAPANSSWTLETALDVEWAHAIAPAANILLVNANDNSLGNLLSAVDYARHQSGVDVVSMSWGASEFSGETAYDNLFTTPTGHNGVAFVAASGDTAATSVWPASSPNVLSIGGTTLSLNQGNYAGETAWSGSGGGASSFEAEPSYQQGFQTSGQRTTPDVAYSADPNSGFAVYSSAPHGGQSGWFQVGGTSAGAPQWSAMIAIADQGRAVNGSAPLANVPAAIYGLAAADFHVVGAATPSSADATGRGSPVANALVSALVAAPSTTAPAAATTTTSTTHPTPPTPPNGHTSPFDTDASFELAFIASTKQAAVANPVPLSVPLNAAATAPAAAPAATSPAIAPTATTDLNLVSLGSSDVAGENNLSPLPERRDVEVIAPPVRTLPSGDAGTSVSLRAATGLQGGALRDALHDACFADESWSAVPELSELTSFGLGELRESFPPPLVMMAALLTSFEGFRRFRKDLPEDRRHALRRKGIWRCGGDMEMVS